MKLTGRGLRHCIRLHGLAPHRRASQCRPGGVLRAEEPLRLEQDKRRHGVVLSPPARTRLRLQARDGTAHQHLRLRPDRALPHRCLGLRRGQHVPSWNGTQELSMHPTVKPVALVADATRDCSRRGEIVLDPFGGSGTTLIAATKIVRQSPSFPIAVRRRQHAATAPCPVVCSVSATSPSMRL